MTERIEIICPCGEILIKEAGDDRREIECQACRRINVLPLPPSAKEKTLIKSGQAVKVGETTTIQAPFLSEIREGTLVGPYEVTGLIGEGGMGRVFTALDRNLQRKVALKILSGELRGREAFVARFKREARAVARLNHPNIVQIYYTGVHGETPYYVMELVNGENLDIILKRDGPFDADRAGELMIQAARGLAAAASEGVIHRDVKPSNMVLERSGVLKITDFGLAKTVSGQSDLTMTGTVVGTPLYMSPEQGESRTIDFRADIYSMGASFYHLMVGTPPFEAQSPVSIILKHINAELPSPDEINKSIPAGLAAVIRKMMAKDPADRYGSYENLIEDLETFRRGREPEAAQWKEQPLAGRASASRDKRRKGRSFVIEEDVGALQEIRLGRASPLRRLLAFGGDFGLLTLLFILLDKILETAVFVCPFMAFTFLYFFLADAKGGVTLGKSFFRCRIGRSDGEDLGFIRSFVRTLFFCFALLGMQALVDKDAFLVSLAAILPLSGASNTALSENLALVFSIWVFVNTGYLFFGQTRRTLHDMVSNSYYFKMLRTRVERISREEDVAAGVQRLPSHPKDPVLAAILSILFPGLGQFYLGDFLKGFVILLTCVLIIPYLYGIFDAYHKAKRINRQLGMEV